jgi:hypothetical protein
MDYKEYWQEAYESLEEELGREPTTEEIRDMELSIGDDIYGAYEYEYGENV